MICFPGPFGCEDVFLAVYIESLDIGGKGGSVQLFLELNVFLDELSGVVFAVEKGLQRLDWGAHWG